METPFLVTRMAYRSYSRGYNNGGLRCSLCQASPILSVALHGIDRRLAAAAPVIGPVRAQHLTVELLPLNGSIQPGGSELVGLHFTLDKGWHVYWVNAGDSGEPPSIKWTLPPASPPAPCSFPRPAVCPSAR